MDKQYKKEIIERFLRDFNLIGSKMKRGKKIVGVTVTADGEENIYEQTDEVEVLLKFNIKENNDGVSIKEEE